MNLRLLGIERSACHADDIAFVGGFFGRAPALTSLPDPTRVVRFAGPDIEFIGVEVSQADVVPAGSVLWELMDDTWTRRDDGMSEARPITWRWQSEAAALGEPEGFVLSAVAPYTPSRAPLDEVAVVEPDPAWPAAFEARALRLRREVGDVAGRIEHVGSTAIPGLCAKPIVDVLVEVPSFDEARRRMVPVLCGSSCEYWMHSDHMIFIERSGFLGQRTHHLHVAPLGHRIWDMVVFRDRLRENAELCARYAALKRSLAERYRNDRELYTDAKAAFVREVID
jgi:GrpB-like predicted nucleotidyltransferase (UPF0157 family)